MKRKINMRLLPAIVLCCIFSYKGLAQASNTGVPHVKLGAIAGNHLENGKVVRPQVSPAQILANPMLIIDSPGWKVMEYKCSMMSSEHQYWGPFVIAGPKLDDRIIEHVKSADFRKGRMFLENIFIERNGVKAVTNNIIIDYSNE